jgi:chromosome segregation ATPase
MGNSPRLDAVLRAGQSQLAATGATGAPGNLPGGALKGKAAADALKKAASADSVMANNPGAPPTFSKGRSTPAAPQGFQMRKGGGAKPVRVDSETGNQILKKSSEVVKDLISDYNKEHKDHVEALRKARAEGEECAKRRTSAVDNFRDKEAKATATVIQKLEKMLKEVEASRDSLQNASDASIAKIEKMSREGGESSKQVEEMKKAIAKLEAEKANIKSELDKANSDSNAARDAATVHEAAELASLAAEWQAKLAAAEKAAADGDVVSSNKVKEYASKLERATEELEAKTKEIKGLEKGAYGHDAKFRRAAMAACEALSEYTKENSEEAFRKTMKSFVTSASAEAI